MALCDRRVVKGCRCRKGQVGMGRGQEAAKKRWIIAKSELRKRSANLDAKPVVRGSG